MQVHLKIFCQFIQQIFLKLPGSVLVNEGKRGKGKGPCNLVRDKGKEAIPCGVCYVRDKGP